MSKAEPSSVRDRLLQAAVELALQGGPAAVTARALTGAQGASPSAVNYHFGGRDGLQRAVHGALAAREAAWREARLAQAGANHGGSAWAFVAGAVFDLAARLPEHLALLEFAALPGEPDPALAQAVGADRRAHAGFWRAALAALGCEAEEAEIWAAIAQSATRLALLDADAVDAFGWLGPSLARLEARLAGRTTPAAIAWLAPARRPAPPERPPGAQRLVDAALRVIAEQGLPATTLRSVAEAAGLSLGSTSYFFDSKADIIRAAFVQLRDEASRIALEDGMQAGRRLRPERLAPGGSLSPARRAIESLYLAGARNPDLRPVALDLRSLVGQTSSQWLTARCGGAADRLDGFIASLISTGIGEEPAGAAPADRHARIDDRLARTLDRLFPPAV